MSSQPHSIVLYDGVCGLCNWWVRFVLKHDSADVFRFASLQSTLARRILERHRVNPDVLDTIYVVRSSEQSGEQLLSKSDAAIYVGQQLGRFVRLGAALLSLLPRDFRNALYDAIGRHRYRLFAKYVTCPLPDARVRNKFLDLHE